MKPRDLPPPATAALARRGANGAAYRAALRSPWACIAGLALLLAALVVCSLGTGPVRIDPLQVVHILLKPSGLAGFLPYPAEFEQQQYAVLWAIRMPRILGAIVVGAALAISGAVMQGVLRNPLADPGILGVSSGAALGAVAVAVLGTVTMLPTVLVPWSMSIMAFMGALTTTWVVVALSRHDGRSVVATMLLAGIAVGSLCGAATSSLTFIATDAQLRSITFWSMGSLNGLLWQALWVLLPLICIPLLLLMLQSRALNAMTLGESEANHLGIEVERVKTLAFVACSVMVGAAVAACGMIGFIGLIAPHLIRLWIGPNHRYLLPACTLLGAILLTAADMLARTIVAPAELPIGIVTALLGAPFFLWLLRRHTAQF